jgi:hypothetical protein
MDGARLVGESIFKGVYFRWPADLGSPPHHMFALDRVPS